MVNKASVYGECSFIKVTQFVDLVQQIEPRFQPLAFKCRKVNKFRGYWYLLLPESLNLITYNEEESNI